MGKNIRFATAWRLALAACLGFAVPATAQLDSPAPPDDPASAFYTLEAIFDRLAFGTLGQKRGPGFVEPRSGPSPTGRTLDEIMAAAPFPDDVVGAAAPQCLAGRTFWSLATSSWGPQVGSMPNVGAQQVMPGQAPTFIRHGYHDGTGRVAGDADLMPGNVRAGVELFGVVGDPNVVDTSSGDADADEIMAGRRAWVDGSEVTGTLGTEQLSNASTIVTAGIYAATTLDAVDRDLVSGNLRAGTTIFGISGDPNVVDTSSGDAVADQILEGQRAWVDGAEVVGTLPRPQRFRDNGDGTVTDLRTGLTWLRNANCASLGVTLPNYANGIARLELLEDGLCGLSDGSRPRQWRMPTAFELYELTDPRFTNPAVPNGAGTGQWTQLDVFLDLRSETYHTSTQSICIREVLPHPCRFAIDLGTRVVGSQAANTLHWVLPVRLY